MNEVSQEVLKRLDALAAKLGVAANALWHMYYVQARIDGFECLGAALLGVVLSLLAFRFAKKFGDDDDDAAGWLAVFGIVLACAALFFFVQAADLLFNPGLWAFKSIVADVK